MSMISRLLRRAPPPTQVRRFDGATGSRRASSMGIFGRVNPEVAAAGASLRSRAAYLAQNNPWIANAVSNWVGALVGPGIVPTSRHPDRAARRALDRHFQTWADSADLEGRTDFWGLQAQIAQSLIVAGEALALLVDTDEGPRLRVLPIELLDDTKSDGRTTFGGVEVDTDGRRLAYWIFPEHPASSAYTASVRIPAEQVLHILKPLAPGQLRGASWLAPIILPASELDAYSDALLVAAKVAALHTGFIVDMASTGGDPYDESPAMEPGAMVRLPPGVDVKFNSPAQLQQADAFLKHNLRQLAAGLGLPDHMVSGDLSGANYSSLRAGLLPFRTRCEQIQYGVLVPQFLAPVWRAVITHGILSGALPGSLNDPGILRADWLPPKPLQVDPAKDLAATQTELELGLTSRRKAAAERGWNLDDLDEEIAAETPHNGAAPNG